MTAPPLPEGVTMRLVLLRHGEPHEAARGVCYGRLDVGLSSIGRLQMRRASHQFRRCALTAVYSSPRRRARESAEFIATGCGARIVRIEERLAEIDFGDLEGLPYDEIERRAPQLYLEWMSRPTYVQFPGGECFRDMRARVSAALADVRRAHKGGIVAIVSHGGVNRVAIAEALGLDPARMFRIDQGHGCTNVIDYFGDEPVVRLINGNRALPC